MNEFIFDGFFNKLTWVNEVWCTTFHSRYVRMLLLLSFYGHGGQTWSSTYARQVLYNRSTSQPCNNYIIKWKENNGFTSTSSLFCRQINQSSVEVKRIPEGMELDLVSDWSALDFFTEAFGPPAAPLVKKWYFKSHRFFQIEFLPLCNCQGHICRNFASCMFHLTKKIFSV